MNLQLDLVAAISVTLIATVASPSSIAQPTESCNPLGYDKSALLELKDTGFTIGDVDKRERFAVELIDCLGHPDPELRDGVAYEGFVVLLRNKQLPEETIRGIKSTLLGQLASVADPHGFRRPFVALVLAEVARTDRIVPYFSSNERAQLVNAATSYLLEIDDYRGFDEAGGWRHGVAHAADFLMQLTLNDFVTTAQLRQIRNAIATQIAPPGNHFYVYGEGERLARPIFFMAARGVFTEEDWTRWFADLAAPAPLESWGDAFSSQAGLARLHNTKAFANAIYVSAAVSDQLEIQSVLPGVIDLLRELP